MARSYKALPPASELWERFEYKPLTGELLWNNHKRYSAWKGKVAGSKFPNGYLVTELNTSLERRRYPNHRLIWKWVTGEDPGQLELDHKNGNRADNRLQNLRLATRSQNRANKTKNPPKGYHQVKGGKYEARIAPFGQRQIILGRFDTEAEARAAYAKASLELHGEFSCAQ